MRPLALDAAAPVKRLRAYYDRFQREAPPMDDLTALVERFVHLKQDLGMVFQEGAGELRAFARYQRACGVERASELSTRHVDAWRASVTGCGAASERTRVRVVSEFLAHLAVLGRTSLGTLALPTVARGPEYRPYIFSVAQLQFLLARTEWPGPDRDRAVAYALIYACGLRVGEAARLRGREVDLDAGTLFIEKTKGNKDRLLPLHPRMAERLRRHRAERGIRTSPEAAFFQDERGRAYTSEELSAAFRGDLEEWGLYEPTRDLDGFRYGSTRVYSLRHSFAVHRLLRWYREGADVQAKLPLLSTYLGHAHLSETQVYLKTTALLLREANRRFAGRWEKEFPLEP